MTDQTAMITGASSGIGRDLAEQFAAAGNNLVLVARRADVLQRLGRELAERFQIRVHVLTADLTDRTAAEAVLRDVEANEIEVDVLVNNAGVGLGGSVADLPLDRQLAMIDLNVTALTALTRLCLPDMIARGRGGILNVASTAAFQPGPFMAVYWATKAYVLSFTEALAEELRDTPLRISCLAPGPTDTGFAAAASMTESRLFKLGTMRSSDVAKFGYRAWTRGRVIAVPGLRNKLGVVSLRVAPRAAIRSLIRFLNQSA